MSRVPHTVQGWVILLLACALASGCAETSPPTAREQPAQTPAPESTPPATAVQPQPDGSPSPSPSAKPDAPRPTPPQAPRAPAAPTIKPQEERRPLPTVVPTPTPVELPKPVVVPPAQTAPPQKAPEKAKPVAKDVVVLTGSALGAVRLQHKLHAEREGNTCTSCHHPSKPERPLKTPQQVCSDCHTKVAAAPMKTRYQAAFHDAKAQAGTCIDCHKTENAKGKKAPLKCAECHKKG